MSREDFEGIRNHAKRIHAERVDKTPERVIFAIQELARNNIKFELKNAEIGHIHAWRVSDGKLFQFYAGTGKIVGFENKRGIRAFVKLLKR